MVNENREVLALLKQIEQEMAIYRALLSELPSDIPENSPSYADTMERKREIDLKYAEARHNWFQLDMQMIFPSDGKGLSDLLDALFHQTFTSLFQYAIWKASDGKTGNFTPHDIKEAEEKLDWVMDDDDTSYDVQISEKGDMEGPYTFNMVCYCKKTPPCKNRTAIKRLFTLSLESVQRKYEEYKNEILQKTVLRGETKQDPYLPG
ncbi:hypothetical protein KAR91_48590, partial [Candidatus Pacearchaeota archaeon]|nr:hypothetical protein [Candidatus Pacearchaeota archaeon]